MIHKEHITSQGDRWDLLAALYRGDPYDYEPIVMANPGVPIVPELPGGVRLVIPVEDAGDAGADPGAGVRAGPLNHPGLPSWRRSGAPGGAPGGALA